MRALYVCVLFSGLSAGCRPGAEQATTGPGSDPQPAPAASPAPAPVVAAPAQTTSPAATVAASQSGPTLDAARGLEIGGQVFEAYLTPHQEGDEEQNTPSTTPKKFRSTTPSMTRAEREAAGHRGHGQIRFSRDLSRAYVDVRVEGIDPRTINMFHIHCGKPGILGPILVDFSLATDLQSNLADGLFTVELKNEHIVATSGHVHGPIDAFTMGCIIPSPSLGTVKPSKVSTIAGMARLALDGELYFNLHTTGHTYFGDIRGQIHPAQP